MFFFHNVKVLVEKFSYIIADYMLLTVVEILDFFED